jgi:hypothetical protein
LNDQRLLNILYICRQRKVGSNHGQGANRRPVKPGRRYTAQGPLLAPHAQVRSNNTVDFSLEAYLLSISTQDAAITSSATCAALAMASLCVGQGTPSTTMRFATRY